MSKTSLIIYYEYMITFGDAYPRFLVIHTERKNKEYTLYHSHTYEEQYELV